MQRSKPASTDVARILIVDADSGRSDVLSAEICSILPAPPQVVEVTCGRAAVEVLRAGNFDIVALDLRSLADLGGAAEDGVAKLVKLAGDALTVALSEGGSVSAVLVAMRAGAHDVIPWPVDGAMFTSRIGALAQRYGRAWSLVPEEPQAPDMAAMLNSAGAALRSASDTQKRPAVLPMWQQEQRIIEDAIACFAGNITLAAQALELNPSTIYRKRQAWAEMENGAKGAA